MGERKSSVLIPCITTLADVMMNALLTCVVSINNVKTAQDRIEDHARRRCLVETVMAGTIAINPSSILLTRSPPGAFRLCFLHNAKSLLDLLWVKASFDKAKATSDENVCSMTL